MNRIGSILLTVPVAGAFAIAAAASSAAEAPPPKKPAGAVVNPALPLRPRTLPEQLIATARADELRKSGDKFADPSPLPAGTVGLPFRIEYAFVDDDVAQASYGDGVLTLSLRFRPGGLTDVEVLDVLGLLIGQRVQRLGTYQGTSAFGATIEIFKSKTQTDTLAFVSHPQSGKRAFEHPYSLEIKTTGSEAKALIANAIAILEGRIGRAPKGQVSGCDIEYQTPSISSPFEGEDQFCWVAVNVDRVAFVEKTTGATIKEWRKAPNSAATIESPSSSMLQGYYPMQLLAARKTRLTGTVTVSCTVNADRWVKNCEVVREEPAGVGFGAEALKAMSLAKGNPAIEDGKKVDGKAQVTITIPPFPY